MLSSHCSLGVDCVAGRFHHTEDTTLVSTLLSHDAALQGLSYLRQFVLPAQVITATTTRRSFSITASDNTHVASLQREG